MIISSRIRETFGIELPLKILFEKPTSAELVLELQKNNESEITAKPAASIQRVSREQRRVKRSRQ